MTSLRYNNQAFLTELDQAIETALDTREKSLLGALYRIQGSAHGWCSETGCGSCPLARLRCMDGLEARLDEILAEHHGEPLPVTEPPSADLSPSPDDTGAGCP